ncbi:prostatic acid phosphatase isoform X1 [Nilaparvata lugens]|uniref:prostatic acid phosphatase isoform X1 n=2 Tax=Nilaparvata lugens TaxID=108931 RepID=UPI00193E53B3|nr:prostatic acid phosphatase isoform X1 [Nilaparvata lugens]
MRVEVVSTLTLTLCLVQIDLAPGLVLDKSTVKAVNIFFRHGARTPVAKIPKNADFSDHVWVEGPGQLTKEGKLQMYRVGTQLRDLYDGFVDTIYSDKELFATSTQVPRTFMSAACVLAGLYEPDRHQKWSETILWSPVPVWTDDHYIDQEYLVNAKNKCPNYEKDQAMSISTLRRENMQNYTDIFDYVSLYGGKRIYDYFDLFEIWDNLECLNHNHLPLPLWASEVYPEKLREIQAKLLRSYIVGTPRMVKLMAGNYMKNLHDQFEMAREGKQTHKLVLHAGHDFSMTSVMAALGIFERIINPSDAVILELHETATGHIVQFLYIDVGGRRISTFNIPRCGNPCFLDTFINITAPIIFSDWKTECGNKIDT